MNLAGAFRWVFWAFFLGKNRRKKSIAKFKIGIWELRGQNPHCKELALTIFFVGVLRGNTIRGNTTRNSERKMAL